MHIPLLHVMCMCRLSSKVLLTSWILFNAWMRVCTVVHQYREWARVVIAVMEVDNGVPVIEVGNGSRCNRSR